MSYMLCIVYRLPHLVDFGPIFFRAYSGMHRKYFSQSNVVYCIISFQRNYTIKLKFGYPKIPDFVNASLLMTGVKTSSSEQMYATKISRMLLRNIAPFLQPWTFMSFTLITIVK